MILEFKIKFVTKYEYNKLFHYVKLFVIIIHNFSFLKVKFNWNYKRILLFNNKKLIKRMKKKIRQVWKVNSSRSFRNLHKNKNNY